MGRGFCGIKAVVGVAESARNESRHPAVTLPAEWHLGNEWRCTGICGEGGERKRYIMRDEEKKEDEQQLKELQSLLVNKASLVTGGG
jgi:hypothetical protein